MKTKIGVNGACGRMGKRIIQLAHEDPSLQIVVAVDFAGNPEQGRDIGAAAGIGNLGVPITPSIPPVIRKKVHHAKQRSIPARPQPGRRVRDHARS